MPKDSSNKISANQGFWYGLKLLGQVSGILLVSALIGWGLDAWFHASPFGLVGGVIVGSIGATILVIVEAYRVLK
ncbi:hypothetical protein EXS54_01495 [Patescibacteria group bacterium]|nr:hypothetical protein [Patescibacteria group bacterium]